MPAPLSGWLQQSPLWAAHTIKPPTLPEYTRPTTDTWLRQKLAQKSGCKKCP